MHYFWCLQFLVCTLTLLETAMACPSSCVCKWKGGKQTVECVNKSLQSLPDVGDSGTQVLDFTGNGLTNLSNDQFQRLGLVNLQKIYLSRCRLISIDSHAFKGLSNLVELDLSNNILDAVPELIFHDMTSLMRLNLNGNPLRRVRNFAFKNLKYLVSLELSRCQLEVIESEAFFGLLALEMLKLDYNSLKFIAGVATLPHQLHSVSLQHNPWYCDCKLADLYVWLNTWNVSQAVKPMCDGPIRLRGAPIKLLDEQELACLPDVSPTSLYLEITEGKNVSLLCRVNAVPEAKVSWRFQDRILQNDSIVAPGVHLYYFVEEGTIEKHSELFIFNANVDDNGTFICSAENQAGRAQSNYTIRIVLREEPLLPAKKIPLEYVAVVCIAVAVLVVLVIICTVSCLLHYRVKRRRRRKKKKSKELALYRDGDGRAASPIMRSGETLSTISGGDGIGGIGGGGMGNTNGIGSYCMQKSNGNVFIADQSILKMPSSNSSCTASAALETCPSSRIFYSGATCNAFAIDQNPDLINDTSKERKQLNQGCGGSIGVDCLVGAGCGNPSMIACQSESTGEKMTAAAVYPATLSPCFNWSTVGGIGCSNAGSNSIDSCHTSSSTTNVINVPVNVCFNHFQGRDLHLAPDKFVLDAAASSVYPNDYGLPKLSTHFPPILPATAFYRTLPHRRHNNTAAATASATPSSGACNAARYAREAEFLTRSIHPASYEHFLSGDIRYNVEGYPKESPAAYTYAAAPAPPPTSHTPHHVSFSDTVQILGKTSDNSIECSGAGSAAGASSKLNTTMTSSTTSTSTTRPDGKKEHYISISLINTAAQTQLGDLSPASSQPVKKGLSINATGSSDSSGVATELKLSKTPRLSVCTKNMTDSPDEGYVGEGPDTTEV